MLQGTLHWAPIRKSDYKLTGPLATRRNPLSVRPDLVRIVKLRKIPVPAEGNVTALQHIAGIY
jgi:hypothetical protein